MGIREAALEQMLLKCDDCSAVVYYIETLEEVIRHLHAKEDGLTEIQFTVLVDVMASAKEDGSSVR